MTLKQLIDTVRYRWKGISTTDPDNEALKHLVQHGLVDIKSHCPMAFLDAEGRRVWIKNESDFVHDWNDNDDVPIPDELLGSLVTYCLWQLYIRDQNDVRDRSIAAMMRRDYLESLGIPAGGGLDDGQ